jgi:hypothetical protein
MTNAERRNIVLTDFEMEMVGDVLDVVLDDCRECLAFVFVKKVRNGRRALNAARKRIRAVEVERYRHGGID